MQRFPFSRKLSFLRRNAGSATLLFVVFSVVSILFGCSHLKSQTKDDGLIPEKFAYDVESGKTMLVGDYTNIGNFHPIVVRGFGLVQRLPGTGADDVNSYERRMVYEEMNKMGIRDTRAILASPTTAVVNILGYMRPGIQENDFFDVEVMLPDGSEAKSLRGGWLMNTPLREMANLGGDVRESKTHAYVEGPIMVDPLASEAINPTGLKKGVILSGARAREPRSLTLHMKSGSESAFITDRIAKEINNRFYVAAGQKKGMATAKSDSLIVLDVHPNYHNDTSRYVRIVQSIACYENQARQLRRVERLKDQLKIPSKSQKAAFQLEAIGKPGIEALRSALSNENNEVRFHAATSLAYLGDGTPAKILTDIARDEPAFRVYALNALSIMRNDVDAEMGLQELLHVSSAETRYGAFRALRTRNPYDRTIRGENLGGQFSYHGVISSAPAMVHLTNSKRPEVVLFGSDIQLKQPFSLDAGPVIFINGQTPGTVIISKFVVKGLDEKRTVSNKLDEIIRAVVDLGGTYPDVMQMICQADRDKVLSCRLEIDCLPEPNRLYRSSSASDEEDEEEIAPKKKGFWDRMNPKTWFEANPGGKSSDHYDPSNMSERD